MSSSFFVRSVSKLFEKLDVFYEYSVVHKIMVKLTEIGKESVIVNFFIKVIESNKGEVIKEKSLFVKVMEKIVQFFKKILFTIYDFFRNISDSSLAVYLGRNLILPLENLGYLAKGVCYVGFGFFITRLVTFTILYSFDLKIIMINGIIALVFFVLSQIKYLTFENIVKNNILAKLLKWFFLE